MYGTPYYIAPEVLKGNYTEKCDMWSIGVIIFIMLSGFPPFNGKSDDEIIGKVRRGQWNFNNEIWATISAEAKDLIKNLLTIDINARLTAIQALEHPWIKQRSKTTFNEGLARQAVTALSSFQVSKDLLFSAKCQFCNALIIFYLN